MTIQKIFAGLFALAMVVLIVIGDDRIWAAVGLIGAIFFYDAARRTANRGG